MQENNLKTYLETVTNIAVLLASILVLSVLAWGYLKPIPKTQFQAGLQIGQHFAPLTGIDYKDSPRTLLVALNSKCIHCDESISFYKRIVEAQRQDGPVRVMALFSEPEAVVKPFLLQHQLDVTAAPSVDFNTAKIAATPTLILVDRNGAVLDFWIGTLSQETEQQVMKAINMPQ
ncbi:MAG TPA: hypothetical protein VGN95_19035 [Pyrinomonadaceae bacterium]|jgi:hypothetical protein|nr:hypothetical protein [Pyrinomonadaceae bacterium]